jgi:hypothetical protein
LASNPLLTISVDFPNGIKLSYSAKRLQGAVGRQVAKAVKSKLRQGLETDGDPLPKPEDGKGKGPLKRTGRLIRSVKYYKGVVVPDPKKQPDSPNGKSTVNMAGLLGVLIYGRKDWRSYHLGVGGVRMSPMTETAELSRIGKEAAQKELDNQVRRGIARLEEGPKKK